MIVKGYFKMNEQKVLHSPFNLQVHKETFVNYLEVVILEDGTIEYAVPSHQLKVTDIIAKKRNLTRREVADLCPPYYYADYNNWLCNEANAIMVWNDFYMGHPNDAQLEALVSLMTFGLFYGKIDVDRFNEGL